MAWAMRGVIEGFYGRPWSWAERGQVLRWCHDRGMTHYLYAPKDDPLHRERWREPYPAPELSGFEELAGSGTLEVGFAISPGLSITYDDPGDRRALATKVDQVLDVGISLVCLALDDIPVRPGLGADQADLAAWLREHLGDRADLLLVPTEYTGTESTPYLEDLARGLPDDVPIAWTGSTVVCDEIRADEATARSECLGGRRPLIWDNYPVNDALMADRLFLGPLRGRDPDLVDRSWGYVANPMVQARSSLLPLASVAGYLRGDDPEHVWREEAEELGILVLAEACDGHRPHELVGALVDAHGTGTDPAPALDELTRWLRAAEACRPGPLTGEADAWADQARAEATAGLAGVSVLERVWCLGARHSRGIDIPGATRDAMLAAALWQELPRARVSVMGPRRGFRPVISQRRDGEWRFHAAAIEADRNAIDRLLALAFHVLDDTAGRPPDGP